MEEPQFQKKLHRIAVKEGITVSDDAIDAIVYVAQGDMRKAINALQGAAIICSTITGQMVYAITATARPDEIDLLLDLSLAGDFEAAENSLSRLLHERGIAPNELLNQCYRTLLRRPINQRLKVALIDHIGETDFRLSEGANSDIQMEALVAKFVMTALEGK